MTYFRTKAHSSGFLEFGSSSWICKGKPHTVAVDGVTAMTAFKPAVASPAFSHHPDRCVGFKGQKIILFPLANVLVILKFLK